ncbi:MAG: bifunctional 3-demethylubiquinol 3-O-methyltransferase/2-polyprenyl-6-hydroxyphenol methylase [Pelagibacteraceae bacterium]|nr:bifunctional 3-demethylubiquinol 3-O-methyltransferase/2-polyprenyl-6-hydroxyphenol methylase [Pelagibacteraceae bacterium]|tara:strand:+ start:8667 stop:9374 length:708 start_codon:yes stop_codon:yes gene_type:complete
MIEIPSKNSELEHFTELSNEWWSENGKFKLLHRIRHIRMKYIIDQYKPKKIKNSKILDIGCGGGLITESLAMKGGIVTGIDFVKNNIKIAKKHAFINNLKINYIYEDIQKLNHKKKYNLIIIFEVLEHLENWEMLVKKIKKLLLKDGLLIISTINRNFLSKIFAIEIAENILKWIPKNTHKYSKLIKPDELTDCLKNEDFIINNLCGLTYNPFSKRWKLNKKNTNINYFCSAKKN